MRLRDVPVGSVITERSSLPSECWGRGVVVAKTTKTATVDWLNSDGDPLLPGRLDEVTAGRIAAVVADSLADYRAQLAAEATAARAQTEALHARLEPLHHLAGQLRRAGAQDARPALNHLPDGTPCVAVVVTLTVPQARLLAAALSLNPWSADQ